ncbi:uncharacterized protein LOC143084143 [Mytilus galloprovincialis]|uniref:uncharacterized protein LOC143084143 n=1 Tax=Mytilus galloprovincialis TaxID=29158 RepID=UPI003F7B8AF9
MIPRIPAIYTTLKIFIQLLCFFIGRGKSLNSSQTKISWEPLEPLLFNEDVILKCSIKDCCPDGTQWTGGKTNSLLTLGRVSNNKAKYEETWGVDASFLKIKNFGIDDGDSLYTCFHGFNKDPPKNLTITGNDFALMPTEETLKKNVTVRNGYLNASVDFLKVYPKPVCNCTFQKLGITEHINVSSSFYPTASIFLNGKLEIGHQICNKDCFGTIQVDCRIGTHEFKVFDAIVDIQFIQSLQKSKEKEISTTSILCVVFGVVVAVTVLVAIAVCVCRRNLKKGKTIISSSHSFDV